MNIIWLGLHPMSACITFYFLVTLMPDGDLEKRSLFSACFGETFGHIQLLLKVRLSVSYHILTNHSVRKSPEMSHLNFCNANSF